jgi:alpha-tubulin suppressor-like RCC1 family protein
MNLHRLPALLLPLLAVHCTPARSNAVVVTETADAAVAITTDAAVADTNIPRVAAGEGHACLRTRDGLVHCWGDDTAGQLGRGTPGEPSPGAVKVEGLTGVVTIAAGDKHTCALTADKSVWCWGQNSQGELGQASTAAPIATPTQVPGLRPVVSLAAAGAHTCVVDGAGQITCWGANTFGECGPASAATMTTPVDVPVGAPVSALALGGQHTCVVVQAGTVKCWGRNQDGQLGNGNTGANSPKPGDVAALTDVRALMAGDDHTCALLPGGMMSCWGDGENGELGTGALGGSPSPAPVAGLRDVVQSAGGREHSCAVLQSGTVTCWGQDLVGELGNGSVMYNSPSPIDVKTITDAVHVAAGANFSCIAHRERGAACWGAALGAPTPGLVDAGTGYDTLPVEVAGL